ncbi:MAG: 2-amino-4-hydroxy-6-hydroxymethyldihydropteridine diphosphokinase [Cyanobacteriota bacterium]
MGCRPSCRCDQPPVCVAIALGANLPSALGSSLETLLAVRQPLQELLSRHLDAAVPQWSPLFRTAPVGGPGDQPDYLNAVVVLRDQPPGDVAAAEALMADLLALEQDFGRQRLERWGPRCLDLDLLWWGDLRSDSTTLQLPHPRLRERTFVLAPLAAIDPSLVPPAAGIGFEKAATVATLLAALLPQCPEPPPRRLPPRTAWPE